MIVFGKERNYVVHNQDKINGFFGDYRFLSNFHVAPFWFEGRKYSSREHAFQAAKYPEKDRSIFDGVSSAESKKLGRQAPVNLDEWNKIKYSVMFRVVLEQFSVYPDLTKALINTGTRQLEESNHWGDTYWGVYYADDSLDKAMFGIGHNQLGHILMNVREILKIGKSS